MASEEAVVLPDDFVFSQASLQDVVDCPRRFQLRYLLRLAWPAVEAEPALENERTLRQGAAFHRLAHQHALGIPEEQLSPPAADADLRRWWHNYLTAGPTDLPETRYPEIVLSAPLAGYRLMAKADLVAVEPGHRAVIVDWKTSRRRPPRHWLEERLQTRVYPYLLVRAGDHLNQGQSLPAEQVEMVYWFAEFPTQPARFAYDDRQYAVDEGYLTALVEGIADLAEADYPLTTDTGHCRFCVYRSLCERGVQAGPLAEMEDESAVEETLEIDLDFDQIAEVEY